MLPLFSRRLSRSLPHSLTRSPIQLQSMSAFSSSSAISPESRSFADEFVSYLNHSATAFHAVDSAKQDLLRAGFVQLKESDQWTGQLAAGGKYFFTRNATALIAFTVGAQYEATNGFTIVGAHTDSPCFRVKATPCSTKAESLVLNTQPYGGGLWHTWFDRDLGLAGRVITRNAAGEMASKLVKIDHPVARIPNLAIHLQTPEERKAFAINLHDHCKAILTMDPSEVAESGPVNGFHPCLMHLINENLNLADDETVLDMELQLIDTQPSAIGGAKDEFIFSGRLDNLCSSFQSVRALIDASSEASSNPSSDFHKNIQVVMLFDHEEVGSSSTQGAGSSMFMDTLKRIHKNFAPETSDALQQAFRRSLIISIDMAHAHHPNYPAKHDPAMAPKINKGLVIKHNANQRYATNTVSSIMFREFGKMADLPMQEFSVRSDAGCGSTIGPITATLTGITTIDVGSPQFSMHSIRYVAEILSAA